MKAIDIIKALGLQRNAALVVMCEEHTILAELCDEYKIKAGHYLQQAHTTSDPTQGYTGSEDMVMGAMRYAARIARFEWATMVLRTMVAAELDLSLSEAAERMAKVAEGQ